MGGTHLLEVGFEIVHVVAKMLDIDARAAGLAVPAVIESVYGIVMPGEMRRRVGIASAVLADPVHQDHGSAGRLIG